MYTDPAGSANLPDQIHDFNVHIDSNDVFWMVQVEHDAVEVDFDEGRARLRVRRLEVFDDHDLANSLTQGLGLPTAMERYPRFGTIRKQCAALQGHVPQHGSHDQVVCRGGRLHVPVGSARSHSEPDFGARAREKRRVLHIGGITAQDVLS